MSCSAPFEAEATAAGFVREGSPRYDTVKYRRLNDTICIKTSSNDRVLDVNINGKPHALRGRAAVRAWFIDRRIKTSAPLAATIAADPQASLDRVLLHLRSLIGIRPPEHDNPEHDGTYETAPVQDPGCAACWHREITTIVDDAVR